MKQAARWLINLVFSPLAEQQLERRLANATLKPRNEIDAAADALRLQLHPINRSRKGIDNEDFPDL